MGTQKTIAMFAVLCLIALGLGYWVGQPKENGNGGRPVPPPHPNAVKWNGHWYVLFAEGLSWDAAKKECEKLGGHLVIIESEVENQFLVDLLKGEKAVKEKISGDATNVFVSIGCYRSDGDQWNWVNGQLLEYSKWNKVAPLDSHRFGAITLSCSNPAVKPDEWVVLNTGEPLMYICEWE